MLENACDVLAFRLQIPIPIYELEVLDITPPVIIGEERETKLFPYPKGYEHTKFKNSQFTVGIVTERNIDVALLPPETRRSLRSVMRWYHKALAAAADLDRFLWLWIALEILWKADGTKVKTPYKAPCNHIIPICPECGKSTEKEVAGESLKRFLSEKLMVNAAAAKALWDTRQAVHGNNDLTKSINDQLPQNCIILESAINLGIKMALGGGQESPPIVSHIGLSNIELNGKRPVSKEDFMEGDYKHFS